MSNVDDILQQTFTDIDTLLHDSAVAKSISFRLSWGGTFAMAAWPTLHEPVYSSSLDLTEGTGTIPTFDYTNGITVPATGLWYAESFVTLLNKNTAGVGVRMGCVLTADNVNLRTTTEGEDGNMGTYSSQIATSYVGWVKAGVKIRSKAWSSRTLVDSTGSQVRLVGPLNSGANL
ncbi:MAG: hypothetical protein E4H44_00325 [Candidatus Aminicenantes bacterium]|nr:MAG: hypothetical protein E4H44_00325 [Candidatus Aminicenantes bacterium]